MRRFQEAVCGQRRRLATIDNCLDDIRRKKGEIDVNAPSARKEFAQDVSGIANRQGSYLIYGIAEDTERSGMPDELGGFDLNDPDAAMLSLGNVLMNRVQPRIDGVEMAAI